MQIRNLVAIMAVQHADQRIETCVASGLSACLARAKITHPAIIVLEMEQQAQAQPRVLRAV
ncbi:MAG: hypothetical protein AAF415_07410 [Pseudomonadota bacterium]